MESCNPDSDIAPNTDSWRWNKDGRCLEVGETKGLGLIVSYLFALLTLLIHSILFADINKVMGESIVSDPMQMHRKYLV